MNRTHKKRRKICAFLFLANKNEYHEKGYILLRFKIQNIHDFSAKKF